MKKKMISLIIFISLFPAYSHAYQYQCSVCMCYYAEPTTLMDCSSRGLSNLPFVNDRVKFTLTSVLLNMNNFTILNENVLNTWELLEHMDIRDNPLQCDELKKVKQGIEVLSDCILPTKGE